MGDKTILDALVPFAETLEKLSADNVSFAQAWREAAAAAEKGMEGNKGNDSEDRKSKMA